ncbi:MAG TPA: MlaD family protein [Solirubrobacteraceae bacterium]|nr:MlaD family protein [Solirubrobacteraceae bacterium]
MSSTKVWWRRGAARIAGAGFVAALVAVALLAMSAGGSGGKYTVRAIFDNAGNIIPGEDVKIDGVKVGVVGSVTPTRQAQAAVVIHINNPGFQDFRADATCTIRPQALIGEKFVDCLPTQPRAVGAPLPPVLGTISKGRDGAGQHLLAVAHTSSPVDVDLIGDIARLPERQRLTIIINEFGAGLAGRGKDLNAIIKRADPALQATDKVLGILASQNEVLAKLAVDSDQALQPLADTRTRVADFFAQSNTVARATADQRGALARNLADLPAFLRQLGPAMTRLGKFADQTTPTFTDLGIAAPGINQTFKNLGPFSKSSTAFFKSFGKTSKATGDALVASRPLLDHLQTLGDSAKPFSSNFAALLSSLRSTGGLERLLDFIFLGAGASNGYDSLGHFLRADLVAKNCVGYAIAPGAGCSANFVNLTGTASKASAARSANTTSLVMQRTLAVLGGATPAQAIAKFPGTISNGAGAGSSSKLTAQPVGGSSAGTTYYTPSGDSSAADGALLNYLLGN